MGSGAVSVMMAGQTEMLQWFAGNWDSGKRSGTCILQIQTALRGIASFWTSFWGLHFLVLAYTHMLEEVGSYSHCTTVCVWSDT